MIMTTNSYYLTYTFLFERLGECTFWTWEWKIKKRVELSRVKTYSEWPEGESIFVRARFELELSEVDVDWAKGRWLARLTWSVWEPFASERVVIQVYLVYLHSPVDSREPWICFSRGGVLEPAGTVEIKFRRKDLVKSMRRLDDKYAELSQALAAPGDESFSLSSQWYQADVKNMIRSVFMVYNRLVYHEDETWILPSASNLRLPYGGKSCVVASGYSKLNITLSWLSRRVFVCADLSIKTKNR